MKKPNYYPITDIRPPLAKKISYKRYFDKNRKQILIIAALVVIAFVGLYAYHQKQVNKSRSSGQGQITDTVNKVGKLFLLPTGEQPTLAIVNDASKYSNVAFFKNAANGDRLLVYAQAREAILYRPSINKIIAVAPLSTSATTPTTTNP